MKQWHKTALWVSSGIVLAVLGRIIYKTTKRQGTVLDGNKQLDIDMTELIKKIEKAPK